MPARPSSPSSARTGDVARSTSPSVILALRLLDFKTIPIEASKRLYASDEAVLSLAEAAAAGGTLDPQDRASEARWMRTLDRCICLHLDIAATAGRVWRTSLWERQAGPEGEVKCAFAIGTIELLRGWINEAERYFMEGHALAEAADIAHREWIAETIEALGLKR